MKEQKAGILESADLNAHPATVGRYVLQRQIARGGMATIHIARLMGDEGFSRIVAAKRLHPEFAEDQEFVSMFLDEARIASKVHHRNVVPVLDVVSSGEEVILVQEYVHGAPLQWMLKTALNSGEQIPVNVAVSIACQVLAGLHATHETVDELGMPLHIVHRDVSPQNVMIATDGTARLLDFGVAKAIMAAHVTREGTYKGKLAYSAPEQLRGHATRQSDIYSLSVLLWELLVGQRMHSKAKSGAELVSTVLNGSLPTMYEALLSHDAWHSIGAGEQRLLSALDPIVSKGLALDLHDRWTTAQEMEDALTQAVTPAPQNVISAWLRATGSEFMDKRDRMIAAEEASWRRIHPTAASGRPPAPGSTRSSGIHLRALAGTSVEIVESQIVRSDSSNRQRKAIAMGVGALLLAVAGGFWLGDRREPEVAPMQAAPNGRVEVPQPAPAPQVVAPVQAAKPVVAPAPIQIEVQPQAAPEPEAASESAKARMDERDAQPIARPRAPRRARVEAPRPEPANEPQPVAQPQQREPADPASDCSTPYYFEGSKKIFKPACL
jgi:serine/threonine protein kinase